MTKLAADKKTLTQSADGKLTQQKRRQPRRALPSSLKRGGWLQVVAALFWLPQAGLLAYAVGLLANGDFSASIYMLAGGVFLLGVVRSVIDAAGSRMAYRAARCELSVLRNKAFSALSSRSPLDATRPASGEAASILTEQAELVVPYLSRFMPVRMRVMVVPLMLLLAVAWYSWVAALVLLIAAPLIPVFMALIGIRAQKVSEEQLAELGGMNGFLLDRLRGLATIRSLGAVDQTATRLRDNAENLRKKTMAVLRIAFLSSAVLELFSALGVAMVAVYIGFHLLGPLDFGSWGHKLTLSEGLFILLLAPAFFEPLRELSAVWHDRAAGEAAIDALEQLTQHKTPLLGAGGSADAVIPRHAPAIVLKGVTYSHFGIAPNNANLFQDYDLSIGAGEHIALLAPSGMGKSTLLALIAGLIAPQLGHITIGGTRLDEAHALALRQRMAWIGQKPHIFAGSPRANITLGRAHIDAAAISMAVSGMALGNVEAIVSNAAIGEGGTGLSGGEALRLALARAAVNRSADIILADEPTAHLDRLTAADVTENLLLLAKGKTLIIATHDEELARRMDRVVRLNASVAEVTEDVCPLTRRAVG